MRKKLQDKYGLYLDVAFNVDKGSLITMGKERRSNPFDMPIVLLVKRDKLLSSLPMGTCFVFKDDTELNYSQ